MDHGPLRMVADTFPWVFAAALLNACGKDGQFCRRQRVLPPLRVGWALTATGASPPGETIADFPGGFQALFGTTITSQAFENQVAKPHGAAGARTLADRLIRERTRHVLGCEKGRAGGEFRRLRMQDGRSLAMHDGWR